jgi:hypothetical protein
MQGQAFQWDNLMEDKPIYIKSLSLTLLVLAEEIGSWKCAERHRIVIVKRTVHCRKLPRLLGPCDIVAAGNFSTNHEYWSESSTSEEMDRALDFDVHTVK